MNIMNKKEAQDSIQNRKSNDAAEQILLSYLNEAGIAINHVLVVARFASAGEDEQNGWTVIAIQRAAVGLEEVTGTAYSAAVMVIRNGVVDRTSKWRARQAHEGIHCGTWIVSSD